MNEEMSLYVLLINLNPQIDPQNVIYIYIYVIYFRINTK